MGEENNKAKNTETGKKTGANKASTKKTKPQTKKPAAANKEPKAQVVKTKKNTKATGVKVQKAETDRASAPTKPLPHPVINAELIERTMEESDKNALDFEKKISAYESGLEAKSEQ